MKVYISADIEGVSGVVHREHTARDGREHDRARLWMTEEVNAAIRGAKRAGATTIIVNDGHGTMRNIILEQLDADARLISGSPKRYAMMQGIEAQNFDAAIFVGYHTQMGHTGVLNHTFHGGVVQSIRWNGESLGEFGLNAYLAAYFHTPVIFVSGCQYMQEEARHLIPSIETAVVKETIHQVVALNDSPLRAQEKIENGVFEALMRKNHAMLALPKSVTVEMTVSQTVYADAIAILPNVERIDATTVQITVENVEQAYRYVRSWIMMASAVQ